MSAETTAKDTIYVEVSGTNCHIDGTPGVVTGVVHDLGLRRVPRAAFVQLDMGTMLYVTLGQACGERGTWREVEDARAITREDFDRLTELDKLRHDLGWREPSTLARLGREAHHRADISEASGSQA